MAKTPTKPASTGAEQHPVKPAAASKAKSASAEKSPAKPAAAKSKPSVEPSPQAAPLKTDAPAEKPSPNVKNSPKPEKKTPAAKAAPAPKTTAPVAKPEPIRAPVIRPPANLDEIPEVVIPKKSPFPAAFLKKQKQRLFDLRSGLLDAMEGVAKDTLRTRPEGSDASVGGMHMGDAGSDAYDRDFALSLLSKEQDALYEINDALKRIDLGSYGICEMTSKPINEERLEALPFARYTREAQEAIERDQQGGRNRRVPVRSVFGLDDEENEDDDDEEEGSSSTKNSGSESSLDFMKD